MIEDVIDLGDIPDEKLSFGAEKIIKEHQNERAKMQEMGPLIHINDNESSITDMTTSALPIPLRRQRYNSSKLQSLMYFHLYFIAALYKEVTMECELEINEPNKSSEEQLPTELRSCMKTETARQTKKLTFGTAEKIVMKSEQCQTDNTNNENDQILENKVDILMKKVDSIIEKIQK